MKYQSILKLRKARTPKKCFMCSANINPGNLYYSEEPKDKFLHTLHNKKYCEKCGENYEKENIE